MKYTAAQQGYIDGQEITLNTIGLELMEKTILKTCELPIGTYPNGKWYTVPAIYSVADGSASYVMRDGKSLTGQELSEWLKNAPAAIKVCPFYVRFFLTRQNEVISKLKKRRDILNSRNLVLVR